MVQPPDPEAGASAAAGEQTRPAEEPLPLGLLPVPPMIRRANEAYLRDLPEMLRTHYRQWVAYHGDQRLGFGRSKRQLVGECLRRGLPDDEFVVYSVEPEIPDDDELELRGL